jgi:TolB-like protein/DNA-binding winged helix-turn-helix (wHTH) protein/Tfp pilus assembly protein PilF
VARAVFEFGDFKLDCDRFELYRSDRALKLERKPMELLILLATKNGNLVTRAEIAERLWPSDFVDTEHGINTAVRKIRQALKDDPEDPRFIQTVTGKGYRLVQEKNGKPSATELPQLFPQSETSPTPDALQPMWEQPPRLSSDPEVSGRGLTTTTTPKITPVPSSSRIIKLALTLCLLLAATLVYLFRNRLFPSTKAAQIHSLAVIPLANLSGDSSQDYFADGMTDELITMLAKNTTLRIVSRTSVMQYKGIKRPLPEIARELNVDGILEGSVERTASRVHMTVQLIYAPTDSHVWAESYDRDLNQAYSLPEELSETIAKEVKAAISPAPVPRHINPEAHDAYLRGRYVWFQFDAIHSLEYFQKAIHLQPDYAAAWAGMADAYAIRAVDNECPASEVAAKTEAAARKAVELDESLPEGHLALGAWYFFYAWDLPRAEAEFKRSIALDGRLSDSHHLYSYLLLATNRRAESLQEQKRATELDPLLRNWGLGFEYIQLRQFDAAINDLQLRAQVLPSDFWTHIMLSYAYREKGMGSQAERELENANKIAGRADAAQGLHRAFERGGEKAADQWTIDDLKAHARTGYVSPIEYARAYAGLDNKDETMKYLEECYRTRAPWLIMVQNEPRFDFLHSDPRYQSLVKKIGLTPAY